MSAPARAARAPWSWPDVLAAAVRAEFRVERYVAQAGDAALFGPACAVARCPRPAEAQLPGGVGLCDAHLPRWRAAGRPAPIAWAAAALDPPPPPRPPSFELRGVPPLLALELGYALQQRHDGRGPRARLRPAQFARAVAWLVREDVRSLLEVDEALFTREFQRRERFSGKAFAKPARAALATLRAQAEGREVWDEEVWPAQRLPAAAFGAFPPTRTTRIDFRGVEPPFLQAALKRWAKGRLLADYAFGGVARYVSSVRLFCQWLREEGIALARPQSIDRALLEAYRLHVAGAPMATATRIARLGDLNQVLADVRAAEWLPIPPGAVYLRGEIPRPREELPKDIDGHVLAQIEDPRNLARLAPLSVQTAVVIMLDAGLRVQDALRLPPDPVETGADGHPYLRFWNSKVKREAVVPLTERAREQIRRQQEFLRENWPGGTRFLLPPLRLSGDPQGHLDFAQVWRRLREWVAECDIRDARGEPADIWPHRFRHTLGTRLLNEGLAEHHVQRLLDHSSPQMTRRYARIRDATLRAEWAAVQERVNVRGERIRLELDGLLGEAAWVKESLARAKQALPNGDCGLPLTQTCPHPNACLTCPSFLTDERHRPTHEEQLARTRALLARAREAAQHRLVEMNEVVERNLLNILRGLDELAAERGRGGA